MILYMSGLKQIGRQLYEAAAIDGTNVVLLPFIWMVPPQAVMLPLFMAVNSERAHLTLPVAIVTFRDETLVRWVPTMASAAMSVIPVVALYLLGQRWFHETNLGSGTK